MKSGEALPLSGLPAQDAAPVPPGRRGLWRGGRAQLLALLLVCSLPGLLATLAYQRLRPQGRTAIGMLITPVRPLPDAQAQTLQGRPVALSTLKGQWLLLKTDGGACAQDCQRQLMQIRQLRLMLGKDMDRVDWGWLVDDAAAVDPALAANLQRDGATVLRLAPALVQRWLGSDRGTAAAEAIVVVDPMGNAMMRLPAQLDSTNAAKARRDLLQLLRASQAWDAPGR